MYKKPCSVVRSMNVFLLIVLVICSTQFKATFSYNIEVNKVGISRGEKGSEFGYTVAIIRKPGWNDRSEFYDKELLVGAPKITYDNIKGHGQVARCATPTEEIPKCYSLNLTDVSRFCDRLSQKTNSNCATDSRLGATMEVNRKFPEIRSDTTISTMPMVTVCAPGWKNVFPETAPSVLKNYMPGMCLKMRDDLKPIYCNCAGCERGYCWPFWPTPDKSFMYGRPVFTYAQGGMAAAFTVNGRSEIIGAPGADDWRGAYKAIQEKLLLRLDNYDTTRDTMYFGYALTSGRFGDQSDLIVSGLPNWRGVWNGQHFGSVWMYKGENKINTIKYGLLMAMCKDQVRLDPREYIDDKQTGSKFGAALEAVDLTGDGYDELLVGAPLYTGANPEEGRVFVYSSSKETGICGPIGILTGGAKFASLKEKSSFARFGTAIASVGDLNKDGYNDVAIGAPYEDGGTGAVYIYSGIGQCGCIMKDQFSQRIAGRDLELGIQSFGWSIYGNEDIDDNSFPDFAVGAYESDTAIVLRTRPIVNVEIEMKMSPNPIPLNGSLIYCSSNTEKLCFQVTVRFQFNSIGNRKGDVDNVTLRWTLDSDTVYKSKEGWSRVEFRNYDGLATLVENITLTGSRNRVDQKTYIIDVKGYMGKPEPKNAWTKVRMEGTYELVPTSGDNFAVLDPILSNNAETRIIENVEFDMKCDNLSTCTSDLKLAVLMFLIKDEVVPTEVEKETVLYIDDANALQVTTDITNLRNSSYRTNVSGDVTAVMKTYPSSNNGLIGASCSHKIPHQIKTKIYCTADSILDRNENMKIKMLFDVSRQRLIPEMDMSKMKQFVHIGFKADQANTDVNMDNNEFEKKITVKLKYQILIQTDKETSDQMRYNADEKSSRKITIMHRFYLINEGPSFLPKTYVNITIPLSEGEQDLAVIKDMPAKCSVRGKAPVIQTPTTAKSKELTTNFPTQPGTDAESSPSEAEQGPSTAQSTRDQPQEAAKEKNITCETFTCAVIECEVLNLEHNQEETIDVRIYINEKELAGAKEVREIRYSTNATVTDPFIWYGGKVVPWDKTVYAEKWTTFVVDPISVVPEVDLWFIIFSCVIGALAVLIIVALILWRCGFFARKKHNQVQQWKKAMLYNRKSMKLSAAGRKPYSSIEEK